jgi:ribosomal protein S18 acetylase RimI-like enzyme
MKERTAPELVPLNLVPRQISAKVLNLAYANYYLPVHATPEQLGLIESYYDVDMARSFMARVGDEWIGIALLALRDDRAWISGVGVAPGWRRRGVARALVGAVLDAAGRAGASQVTLEVIACNIPAYALYASLGFRMTRELLTWERAADADPLPFPRERLARTPVERLLDLHTNWHAQRPAWQHEAASLARMLRSLVGYRLDHRGSTVAYCIVSGGNGTLSLMDVGIERNMGQRASGIALLQAVAHVYEGHTLAAMNIPADDDLNSVLARLSFLVVLRQHELVLDLTTRNLCAG